MLAKISLLAHYLSLLFFTRFHSTKNINMMYTISKPLQRNGKGVDEK